MNSNRLPLVGFVIMIIVAVFALVLQQQAVNDLRTQMTRAASANSERVTAVAMKDAASGTQVKAEFGQATALAAAQAANTAQSTAQAAAGTALAQLDDAGTRSAQFAATATANFEALLATATMHTNDLATLQAESTSELATLQGQLGEQSTQQAQLAGQLGTATAQVDLAEFARKAAEDDRTNALNQLWALGTRQADSSSQLATAQAMLTGAPPATAVPTATASPELQVTTVNDSATSAPGTTSGTTNLTKTFQSTDKKVQVNYPEAWVAEETQNGAIVLVSDQSILTRTTSALSSGQVQVEILVAAYNQFNLTPGDAPVDMLNTILTAIKSNQSSVKTGEVAALTLGGHKAAQTVGSDGNNDVNLTLIQLSDTGVAVIFGSSALGEGQASMDTLTAIMSSITYSG